MGVKELWPAIECTVEPKSFEDLRGQTVAVDLSMWIVDSQCVKQMTGVVTKPHLRNLFFRVSALLNAGVLPVFVVEGRAPELKWQTMAERQNLRTGREGYRGQGQPTAKRANRRNFNSVIKECCEMLDYLGVPHMQAAGEAEALCAALNQAGLVNAVITEDGDAFLYGARTVYRNFSTTKTPNVESVSMEDVQEKTGLYREHMIALALLVGSDYCPKGVPGVGKTQALRLCQIIPHHQILDKLEWWSRGETDDVDTACARIISQKISRMEGKNFSQIIKEFMNLSCKLPSSVGVWCKPLLAKAQSFNLDKLEWPINYSLEKLLPLLTLWCLRTLRRGIADGRLTVVSISPQKIVKRRVRQGNLCLELLWNIADPYEIDEEDEKQPQFTTIERLDIVSECYPHLVDQFSQTMPAKSKKIKDQKITSKKSEITTGNKISQVAAAELNQEQMHPDIHLSDLQKSFTQLKTEAKRLDDFIELNCVALTEKERGPSEMLAVKYPTHDSNITIAGSSITEKLSIPPTFTKAEAASDIINNSSLGPPFVSRGGMIEAVSSVCSRLDIDDSELPIYDCFNPLKDYYKHSSVDSSTPRNVKSQNSNSIISLNVSSESLDRSGPCHQKKSQLSTKETSIDGCPVASSAKNPVISYLTKKRVQAAAQDSLDLLLNEISCELESPVSHSPLCGDEPRTEYRYFTLDSPHSNSIITGCVTPDQSSIANEVSISGCSLLNHSHQLDANHSPRTDIHGPDVDSTTFLFDVESVAEKSDVSLLDVKYNMTLDQTPSLLKSHVLKSTPQRVNSTTNTEAVVNITLGNFDILPNFSDLDVAH